jgi:hypothetical protein
MIDETGLAAALTDASAALASAAASITPDTEPPPVSGLPDLIVENAYVTDPIGPFTTGDPLLCAADVRNTGERILPGVIIGVAFYFGTPDNLWCQTWSDTYLDGLDTDDTIHLVANGGFNGATFPAAGPILTVEARVDDTSDVSRILESNENNNRYRFTVDVESSEPVPPDPPNPDVPADAKLTLGDFPTDGPQAHEWATNFETPLGPGRKCSILAQNLGGGSQSEFMSRAWGIANPVSYGGQDLLRYGRRIALTVPGAFPPPGVAYGNVTNAQKRQGLLDTAAGLNDGTYQQGLAYLNAGGVPDAGAQIDSRICHEPDVTWYCWSAIAGGIDAYQAATRHLIGLWKAGLPSTRITFNMNGAMDRNLAWSPVPWGTGQSQTELIFTGLQDLCEAVAADIYYGGDKGAAFTDVERKVTFLLAWSNAWQLPAAVPEWGLDSVDWPDAVDHWRAQMERFADGQLLYHVYFDGWEPAALRNKPQTRERFYSPQGFGS